MFVRREIEHYRKIKEQFRTKTKRETDVLTSEIREAILAQGREQVKQEFLRKISNNNIPISNLAVPREKGKPPKYRLRLSDEHL